MQPLLEAGRLAATLALDQRRRRGVLEALLAVLPRLGGVDLVDGFLDPVRHRLAQASEAWRVAEVRRGEEVGSGVPGVVERVLVYLRTLV